MIMHATDFEYDGRYLNDYGFIVCNFNSSSSADVIDTGSKITFNTVPRNRGNDYSLVGTQYDECIEATFDICKNPDIFDDLEITESEYRDLIRWLNRKDFHRFKVLDEEIPERELCCFDATFNVQKIKIHEVLYGLELSMITSKPFGYGAENLVRWNITDTSKTYYINDNSDEIGYIYPSLTITCSQNGNLSICNETENCRMVINNCLKDEVITIDGEALVITTSNINHHIYDDFNFDFLKIGNTIDNRVNKITVSLPCRLEIKYNPIIKDSP